MKYTQHIQNFLKITNKDFEYLRANAKLALSKDEIHLLYETRLFLSRQYKIVLSEEQLNLIWLTYKDYLLSAVNNCNIKNNLLQFFLFWSRRDTIFAQLQINPTGNLKQFLNIIQNIESFITHLKCASTNKLDTITSTDITKDWIRIK